MGLFADLKGEKAAVIGFVVWIAFVPMGISIGLTSRHIVEIRIQLSGLEFLRLTETSSSIISKKAKTYNRRDSQMVTHSSTSRPVQCLCMAERTGCPVLTDLWSYVIVD